MVNKPLEINIDLDLDKDERVCFYSRVFGDSRIVIIPKDSFDLSETETAFILTMKEK